MTGKPKNMEAAVAAIRTCKTRESLDDMLTRFDLIESQEIINCLNECMYNPKRFFSDGQVSLEEDLELTKQIFIAGTWRLNEYYDRMGIPAHKVSPAHA